MIEDKKARLAQQIKNARRQAGLTQARLAESIGVHVQSVKKWESAKGLPTLKHLWAIEAATGKPIWSLLYMPTYDDKAV